MIKIDFEILMKHGVFKDAIYLPEEHTYTEQQIEDMKQARYQAWLDHVDTMSSADAPAPLVSGVEDIDDVITVGDATYIVLQGTPPPDAEIIKANNKWYIKQ